MPCTSSDPGTGTAVMVWPSLADNRAANSGTLDACAPLSVKVVFPSVVPASTVAAARALPFRRQPGRRGAAPVGAPGGRARRCSHQPCNPGARRIAGRAVVRSQPPHATPDRRRPRTGDAGAPGPAAGRRVRAHREGDVGRAGARARTGTRQLRADRSRDSRAGRLAGAVSRTGSHAVHRTPGRGRTPRARGQRHSSGCAR